MMQKEVWGFTLKTPHDQTIIRVVSYGSRLPDSNRGPSLYKSVALPTELRRQFKIQTTMRTPETMRTGN